jgi:hypothetical protein
LYTCVLSDREVILLIISKILLQTVQSRLGVRCPGATPIGEGSDLVLKTDTVVKASILSVDSPVAHWCCCIFILALIGHILRAWMQVWPSAFQVLRQLAKGKGNNSW